MGEVELYRCGKERSYGSNKGGKEEREQGGKGGRKKEGTELTNSKHPSSILYSSLYHPSLYYILKNI